MLGATLSLTSYSNKIKLTLFDSSDNISQKYIDSIANYSIVNNLVISSLNRSQYNITHNKNGVNSYMIIFNFSNSTNDSNVASITIEIPPELKQNVTAYIANSKINLTLNGYTVLNPDQLSTMSLQKTVV